MAKKPYRGRGSKKTKAPKMNNLMSQFQTMQKQMADQQKELEGETVTVSAGGGALQITITGHQRVEALTLNPEAVDPEDVEFLQDMLVAGINAAIEQSQAMAAQKMEGVTGGMDVNSLLGGLG